MKRFRIKALVIIVSALMSLPFEAIFSRASATIILPQLASQEMIPEVITPLTLYATLAAKSIANEYNPGLSRLMKTFGDNFPASQFRMYTTLDAPVGGLGFWLNPSDFSSDDRYMGVCARMLIPDSPFRDDTAGHLAAVMDRYGKSILKEMGAELAQISDPSVKGVALVFVYARGSMESPDFKSNAEAFALYIKKPDVDLFNQYRMTLQTLLNNSEIFLFQGESQIQTLTTFFLQA